MLVQIFPKLKNVLPVKLLREFLSSGLYFVLVGLLMALGSLFAIERFVFWSDFALIVLALFFADDARATAPIACCGYMSIGTKNNPIFAAREGRTTIFQDRSFQLELFCILLIAVVLLIVRFVMFIIEDPHRAGARAPKLFLGFVFLGAAYMLGGGFSTHYTGRTILFGFVQIVSLAFFYFMYYYSVDWKTVPKWYAPAMIMCVGLFVSVEVFGMYLNPGVFTEEGVYRGALYTGWGTYNNVGCIMAMCIPAPCYFAVTRKHGWAYTTVSIYLLLATLLTQSRGGMLFGTATFALCMLWVIAKSEGKERLYNFIIYMALLLAVVLAFIVLREKIDELFRSVVEAGFGDSNRFNIWRDCWDAFKSNPMFGVGFYDTPGFGFEYQADPNAFIPARAHNTYIQLVATGGIALVAAYLFHRFQTLWMLLRRRSPEKYYALFVVAALVLTGIVDCHFFNIGPGIIYGIVLVFAEKSEGEKSLLKLPSGRRPLSAA